MAPTPAQKGRAENKKALMEIPAMTTEWVTLLTMTMMPKFAALRIVSEISCASHNSTKLRFFSTCRKLAISGDGGEDGLDCVSGVIMDMVVYIFPAYFISPSC